MRYLNQKQYVALIEALDNVTEVAAQVADELYKIDLRRVASDLDRLISEAEVEDDFEWDLERFDAQCRDHEED